VLFVAGNVADAVASGERVDVKLAPLQGISFIRAGATDGTAEVTILA
jgi:hypothetical protein